MPDSDDYMRLVQVFRWLDTGDWWGRVLPRLNPPDGALINWARLADLPYAVLVSALSPLMGRMNAAIAAAAIIPPLLQLPIFLCIVSWAGRPILGWRLALLCGPLAVLSDFVFFQFIPGRADHHSWHVIVSTLLLGCIIRLALKPMTARLVSWRRSRWPLVCGSAAKRYPGWRRSIWAWRSSGFSPAAPFSAPRSGSRRSRLWPAS
jgi:asparagine N-glycosylation enzyme membrane subunit Stt3